MTRHTFAEWEAAYKLLARPKRTTPAELVGPCPSCGGDDRFHIKYSGGKILAGCRKCEIAFADLARLLFPAAGESAEASYPASVDTAPKDEPEPEVYGCTLAELAARVHLPVEFLTCQDLRLADSQCWISKEIGSVPAVRIPYLDEHGDEIGAKFRVQIDGGDKYRHEKGSTAALYGGVMLPAARSRGKLWICEGETDVMVLAKAGIPAAGIPGASSVRVLEQHHLADIDTLYAIEEPDEAGAKFPAAVRDRVREIGFAGAVLRMRLPAKDPCAMWVDSESAFRARFLRIALHARGIHGSKVAGGMTAREITRATFPPVAWIVPDILREGIALVYARPKVGKSHLAVDLAVSVSQGRPVFGGWETEQSEVLVIDREEIIGAEMRHRLMVHGGDADQNQLYIYDEWPRLGEGGMREIAWWLEDHPRCRLIVVDVWTNIKPTTAAPGANAYDREYIPLQQLRQIALRSRACIVLVHHDKKTDGTGDVIDSASGTKALTGAANTIWRLQRNVGEQRGSIDITGRGVPERTLEATFDRSKLAWKIDKDISSWMRNSSPTF